MKHVSVLRLPIDIVLAGTPLSHLHCAYNEPTA